MLEGLYCLFLIKLRLLNTNIQHKREAREAEKKHEGGDESAGRCTQARTSGRYEGSGKKIEVYNAVIRRKILLSVKCRGKRRADRGASAVAESDKAKTDDANGKGFDNYRKKSDARRNDSQKVRRDHRKSSALRVKDRTRQNSSESVASGKHTDKRCRKPRARTRRECKIARKADNRISDGNKADHASECKPEGHARKHLQRRHINNLEILGFLCRLLFCLGKFDVRRGLAENDAGDADHCRHYDSEKKEGSAPTDSLVCEKRVEQRAENERCQSESHQHTARAEAALVGKPGVDRGDDDVVSNSDAESRENSIGNVKHSDRALHKGGDNKPAARKQTREDKRKIGAEEFSQSASKETADAEGAHRQREIESKLGVAPAEFIGKRNLENRPSVNDARKSQAERANGNIKPTQRKI